jgi:SAM-dependent methyltransferase
VTVERDTDRDWRELGASEPYWGVLSVPEFKGELSIDRLDAFFATGLAIIDHAARSLARFDGRPFRARAALDFGCGVGRLTEAMRTYADAVTGYDVSPGMLEEGRRRGAAGVCYVSDLPDGPFDWINSFLVFQHIPTERGYRLFGQLLDRLSPGGSVSLQFTTFRSAEHRLPVSPDLPIGTMTMYDYDLSELCRMLHEWGLTRLSLEPQCYGGHYGARIFAKRDA